MLLDEPFSALDSLSEKPPEGTSQAAARNRHPNDLRDPPVQRILLLGSKVIVLKKREDSGHLSPSNGSGKRGSRGEAWNALGWGNLFRGTIARCGDGAGFCFTGRNVRLALGNCTNMPGEGVVFISPDTIRLLYPSAPIDPELQPNIFSGAVQETVLFGKHRPNLPGNRRRYRLAV